MPTTTGELSTISEQDVAEVISKWTGIPLTKLTEGEAEKSVSFTFSEKCILWR